MILTSIDKLVWFLQSALTLAALTTCLRCRLESRYPWFVTFLTARLLCDCVQIACIGNYTHYFYAYWTSTLVVYCVEFLALFEIFRDVCSSLPGIPAHFPKTLTLVISAAAFVSVAISVHAQVDLGDRFVTLAFGLQRTALMAWCASFVACALCTSQAGLGWRRTPVVIATGMVLLNASGMCAAFLFSFFFRHSTAVDRTQSLLTCMILIFWSVSLKAPVEIYARTPIVETLKS